MANKDIAILVFAAGASRRMQGRDKLLEPVQGQPLLANVLNEALATGQPVSVMLPPNSPDRERAIDGSPVRRIVVEDAAEGMSASLRAGITALPENTSGALFLMADMPDLRAADLRHLIAAFTKAGCDRVVRATAQDGTPGSPSVVPRRLFSAMAALSGDQGGRVAMKDEDLLLVPLPARRALTDLDTPDDWAAWRAANEREK